MILQVIVWILAIYGFIEIVISVVNSIIFVKNNIKDAYILIIVKNQEDTIEGIIRSIIFKNIYNKNENVFDNIIVADMGSTDNTLNILKRLSEEYSFLKVISCDNSNEFLKYVLKDDESAVILNK